MPIDKDRWNALSPLLDELLEADESARAARLAQLRLADDALADQVAALLARQSAMKRAEFLEGAAVPAIEPTLAGQQVGSYTLDRLLGHGGMGVVWLAHRSDGRYEGQAAIKFLSLALFGPEGLNRFKREGSVLARLTHPNIARLGDAGITPSGQPYLVLEYIEGEPIDRWCDIRALDVSARIRLFLQVLAAVEHAHGKLILHRDLKPSNILVTAEGQVKLLDFGIAKLLDDAPGTRAITELTQAAGRALSPDYAAPEQVQGDDVTTATDVYSLGVLLYMLLTAHHPTSRATQTPLERLRATLETDPTRPSEIVTQANVAIGEPANLRLRTRALRGDLDNILLKALRKSPTARYASVAALADDLQRFLNHEPVSARADGVAYHVGKFVRRHRVGVVTAAVVLIAAVIVAAVTTQQMIEARRQRDEAQYQSRRAESVSDFLHLLLRSDGGPDRPALTLPERIDAGVKMLETQYRDDPRFAGQMLMDLTDRLSASSDNQQLLPLLQRAYDLGKQAGDSELMASVQCRIAQTYAAASVMDQARPHMAEAERLLAQVERPAITTRMECMLAQTLIEQGNDNLDAAAALMESAIQIIESTGNTHHPMYTTMLSYLSSIDQQRNDIPAALALNQRALEAHERYGRANTNDYVIVQQNRASMLSQAGEVRESLARRELINRRIREFEPEGLVSVIYTINYSALLVRMARPDEAKPGFEGVLDRARKAQNPAVLTRLLLATAESYIALGQWTQADAVLAEAAPLVDGRVAGVRAALEMRRAQLSLGRRDLPLARQHIESALDLMGYETKKPDRALSKALIVAADIALQQGRAADAEKFASEALALGEKVARGPDTSADVGEALLRLAKAKVALDAPARARAMLARSVLCLSNGLGADHPLTHEARAALAKLPP